MSKKISTEYSNNPTRGDDTTRDIIIPAEDADTGEDVALKTSQLAEFIDDDLGIRSETNGLTADINDLRDDVDYLLVAVTTTDTPVAGSATFTVTPGANNLNVLVGVNVGSMNATRIWIQQGTRTAPTTTSQGTEASWSNLRYFVETFPDWTSETFTVDVYDSDALTWVQATDGAGSTSIIATPVYNLDPPVPTSITATPGAAGSGEVVVSWSQTEPPPGLDQTNIFIRNASDDTIVGSYYDQTPSATLGNLPMGIDLYAEVELQSNPTPAIQYSRANSSNFNIDLDDAGDFDGLIWIDVSPSATRRFSEANPSGAATFDVHVSGSQSDANVTVKVSTQDTPAASGGVLSFDTTADIDAVNDEIDITGHGLSTGDVVSYRKNAQNLTGNTSAVGLTDGDQLWVRRVSADAISLHTSLAGAQADTGQVVLNTDTAETHYLIYNDYEEFSDIDVDITVSGGTGSATVTVALVDTDNIYNRAFDAYLPPTQDMGPVSTNGTAVIVGRYDEVAQGRSNAIQLISQGTATATAAPQVDDVTAGANTVKGVVFDVSDWDRQEDNGASIPWTTARGAGTFPDTPIDMSDAEVHSSASAIVVGGGNYEDAAAYYDSAPRIEHDFDTNGNLGTYELWMLTFSAAAFTHRFWPTLDGTEQFNNAGSPTTAAYAASPSALWEWRKVGKSLSTDLSCTINTDGVHTFGMSCYHDYFAANKAILYINDGSAAALNFDPNDEGSADPSGSHAATGPAVTTKTSGVTITDDPNNPAQAHDPGAVSTVDYDPTSFLPIDSETQVSITPLLRLFWPAGTNSITVDSAKVVDSSNNETICTTEVGNPNVLRLTPNADLLNNEAYGVVAGGFVRQPDNTLSPWAITGTDYSFTTLQAAASDADNFFEMDLSSYPDGTIVTQTILREIFGYQSGPNSPLDMQLLHIITNPYGSGKVLRMEIPAGWNEPYFAIGIQLDDLVSAGYDDTGRDVTLVQEWGVNSGFIAPWSVHGSSLGIVGHGDNFAADNFSAAIQMYGSNAALEALGVPAPNVYQERTVDRQTALYYSDQSGGDRREYANTCDETQQSPPISSGCEGQLSNSGFTEHKLYVQINQDGSSDGKRYLYEDGQLVIKNDNVEHIAAGQSVPYRPSRALIRFLQGGGGLNTVGTSMPPNSGKNYVYLKRVALYNGAA